MRVEPALELGRESCSGKDHAESCSLLVSGACVDDPRDRCRTTPGDERMLAEWRPAGPRCIAAITVFKPAEISRLRRRPHIRGSREAAESRSGTERRCWRPQPRESHVGRGCRPQRRLCALSASTDDKAADVAGQPGHRHRQSVHVERLQLGRRADVHGAALHAESARPLALGCGERQSTEPALPGRGGRRQRPASARSAAGRSPSGADSPCTRDRRESAVSASAATPPAPTMRSPSAYGWRPASPPPACRPTRSSTPPPTVRRLCSSAVPEHVSRRQQDRRRIACRRLLRRHRTRRPEARIEKHRAPNDFRTGRTRPEAVLLRAARRLSCTRPTAMETRASPGFWR